MSKRQVVNGVKGIAEDGAELIDSASKRSKQANSHRTGQACDRCKTRKIKCDASPTGCQPCHTNGNACTTTDRITGKSTARGELEGALYHIRELEARLAALGEDVKPFRSITDPTSQSLGWLPASQNTDGHAETNGAPVNGYLHIGQQNSPKSHSSDEPSSDAFRLPDVTTGIAGYKYLGVSTDDSFQTASRGTKLSMLGWEVNIADLVSSEPTDTATSRMSPEAGYDKSYESFVATAFGTRSKIESVNLMPRKEGLACATSYLQVLNAFLPILDGPLFMNLLKRFYDDPTFGPSAAEIVLVNMMFAIVLYQDGKRNWQDPARQVQSDKQSTLHYHYCLGILPKLIAGHTLEDVQALTMLASHARNFPKPEVSWLMVNMTLTKAIEMNLHKSAERWAATHQVVDTLEIEGRKRIFWCIVAIHVTIGGKLGRPMPLRIEDIDTELPKAINDDLNLNEDPTDNHRHGTCSFLVGLEAFKLLPTYMDLFNSVHTSKRSPQDYIPGVRRMESQMRVWSSQWPLELRNNTKSVSPLYRVFNTYLNLWIQEHRLLLRHPSLSLTSSAEFNNENLESCMDASRKILSYVKSLQEIKSLDTTWYSCASFILAIQTTLYGHGQLKRELTQPNLTALRSDMEAWLGVMGDIGVMLGSGRRLQNTIREQIESGLKQLEKNVSAKRTAKADVQQPAPKIEASQSQPVSEAYHQQNDYEPYSTTEPPKAESSRAINYLDPGLSGNNPHAYTPLAQYTYSEPATGMTYATMPPNYGDSPYPAQVAAQALMQQPGLSQGISATGTDMIYANTSANNGTYGGGNYYGADSQSWYQYTRGIPTDQSHDYNPASALLQLGVPPDQPFDSSIVGGSTAQWPTMLLENTQGTF